MTKTLRLHRILNDKAFRYRVEKWFWVLNVPAALVMYLFFRAAWESVSILYLALVSIYALVLTAGGAEQAAEAAAEATASNGNGEQARDKGKRAQKKRGHA